MSAQARDVTPIKGIRYYYPPDDAVLVFKDGTARIPYDGLPIPLLQEDCTGMEGAPSYDMVGRGIYHALRSNPDCTFCEYYAGLLRDAYPHFLAELGTHAIMLDSKDVEVPYLDRKITSLKILALLEPGNPGLPLEIGRAFLDKGLRMSALHLSTVSLYRAEHFLRRALLLAPDNLHALRYLGETCYLLGKYADAASLWSALVTATDVEQDQALRARLDQVIAGTLPLIPPVDYLEAIGVALAQFQSGEFDEAAAIIQDVMADQVFAADFIMPDIHVVLGRCYAEMNMPRYAEEEYLRALELDPANDEARAQLHRLTA